MMRACVCRCHQSRIADVHEAAMSSPYHGVREEPDREGFDVRDSFEAVLSCRMCEKEHVVALLNTRLLNEPEPYVPDPLAWKDSSPNLNTPS